jgi:archaemetzincin
MTIRHSAILIRGEGNGIQIAILEWLLDRNKNDEDKSKLLAICDLSIFEWPKLCILFGKAHINGKVSAIYLSRLRQEFYGLKSDKSLFYQRIIKEAVHELGHAFGLNHCNNPICVMHFSNSILDTDIKGKSLCNICRARI